jgi:hypothetical protein
VERQAFPPFYAPSAPQINEKMPVIRIWSGTHLVSPPSYWQTTKPARRTMANNIENNREEIAEYLRQRRIAGQNPSICTAIWLRRLYHKRSRLSGFCEPCEPLVANLWFDGSLRGKKSTDRRFCSLLEILCAKRDNC